MKGILIALSLTASTAMAGPVVVPFNGSFEDATFAVESAIIDRGLVIEYVSRVGEMLNRTGADVGSDVKIFDAAELFIFCSAVISRKVMEADPMNIEHCPYVIFVTQQDDKVLIGHREYPEGPMQIVEELLAGIVAEAVEF